VIRKAFYLGLVAVSAWQFLGAVNRYLGVRSKREHKEALRTWENEGGNPAPARHPSEQRA
jgi:hypothetical protein